MRKDKESVAALEEHVSNVYRALEKLLDAVEGRTGDAQSMSPTLGSKEAARDRALATPSPEPKAPSEGTATQTLPKEILEELNNLRLDSGSPSKKKDHSWEFVVGVIS